MNTTANCILSAIALAFAVGALFLSVYTYIEMKVSLKVLEKLNKILNKD